MSFEITTKIEAPTATVWDVLVDVATWPEWTRSMERVTRLESGTFTIGSQARIKQPRLRPMTWTVTELTPHASFTWEARSPGLVLRAGHVLQPLGAKVTEVRLVIEQRGVAAWLAQPFTSQLARRYVAMEANGLKARAEAM
jgi:uncharacterized protein YndB with AHSA1/START domain